MHILSIKIGTVINLNATKQYNKVASTQINMKAKFHRRNWSQEAFKFNQPNFVVCGLSVIQQKSIVTIAY